MVGKPQRRYGNRYVRSAPAPKKNKTHVRLLRQVARQQAIYQRMSWRDYQRSLNQNKNNPKRVRRIFIIALLLTFAMGTIYVTFSGLLRTEFNPGALLGKLSSADLPPEHPVQSSSKPDRTDIKEMVAGKNLLNLTENNLDISHNGQRYRLETSLDPALQSTLIDRFDKTNSRYIGIVAMAPNTGRIRAYVGFNKTDEDINPCTTNKFPAASIFKIVTAAAAAEQFGYTGETLMKFNGFKHTLYKNQLKDKENRYTNRISFRNSFAQSINPVFGKIGSLRLGKTILEKYGSIFGFNHQFNSELEIAPSQLQVTEDTYHQAEIASGFNRDTTISPIHATMIVATALNGGRLIEPKIIDRIYDDDGNVVYQDTDIVNDPIITAKTAAVIHNLMEATVTSGTARKAFRSYRRDKTLKKLTIGGKTGSIFNKAHDARFDWFVGFAKAKDHSEELAIAVVVAHEEYIGRRAGDYARIAFTTHFKNFFAKKDAEQQREEKS